MVIVVYLATRTIVNHNIYYPSDTPTVFKNLDIFNQLNHSNKCSIDMSTNYKCDYCLTFSHINLLCPSHLISFSKIKKKKKVQVTIFTDEQFIPNFIPVSIPYRNWYQTITNLKIWDNIRYSKFTKFGIWYHQYQY